MIYTLNLIDEINKKSESLRNWITEHGNNPLFWLVMFGAGIIIFFITYNALQTEK